MIRVKPEFTKDPIDLADITLDWLKVLEGDTIAGLTSVTIAAVDPQVGDVPLAVALDGGSAERKSSTASTTTVWLKDGHPDREYDVAFKVATAGGRTLERSALVRVRQM